MSVNINVSLSVTGLTDQPQVERVVEELRELMGEEGISREVEVSRAGGTDGDLGVVAANGPFPLSISRFSQWQPHFEGMVAFTVREVAPQARIAIDWGYPDER
ncbi:hypothetical protein [Kitasatospora camelliae]|uniref:Uncharacterized protein n=1 Tax=Kitasatospora camelliae TaxID=3156397 RepID=A0AAU8K7Q6_9ACTN